MGGMEAMIPTVKISTSLTSMLWYEYSYGMPLKKMHGDSSIINSPFHSLLDRKLQKYNLQIRMIHGL